MAAVPLGYQCEFVDAVPKYLYCNKCSLVARELTITSCCGESYCNGCIHSNVEDKKPCPGCGQTSFKIYRHGNYQRKILSLRVHCSVKERGCGWCGPLEHLDAHLDPDTGGCQYTDIDCPLKCQHKINKKNLEHHLAKECIKRDYVCPYCAFKAPYEIVTDIHWPKCSRYPLVCPNRCGVTCERSTMEDHLKVCQLQRMGSRSERKLSQDDANEYMTSQTRLTTASASAKMQREFREKLQEQERRFEERRSAQKEEFAKLQAQREEMQHEFQRELQELEKKFEDKLLFQKQRIAENMKIQAKKLQKLEAFAESTEKELLWLQTWCGVVPVNFIVEDFSKAIHDNDWSTHYMYTHRRGCKFCIGMDGTGSAGAPPGSVAMYLCMVPGEYDDKIQWPTTAQFTLELINHFEDGGNKTSTITPTWDRPSGSCSCHFSFLTVPGKDHHFISHTELPCDPITRTHFLKNDTLHFRIYVDVDSDA